MTRRDFLRISSLLGIGAPFFTALSSSSCDRTSFFDEFDVNFSGKVLVIGAGAAGLTAGYILNKHNIEFEILEASSRYGGRLKEIKDFADFPIDLGAEWIHTNPSILATILNDPSKEEAVDIITYRPETMYVWRDEKLRKRNFYSNFYSEYKFKSTTWFSFYEQFIVPDIIDQIVVDSPVSDIDYSGDQIIVTNTNNETYVADRLILTVPLTVLQKGQINFSPALPPEKVNALDQVSMPDGIKIFMEFSERFYPDLTSLTNLVGGSTEGERLYYDAAFGKDSERHILGLFAVNEPASIYTDFETEEALMEFVLSELDTIFEGQASQTYIKHVVQNWSKTPYIEGSYSHYEDYGAVSILSEPIDNKLFFAGEAYVDGDSSTVHGASESAYTVMELLLRNEG